MAQIEVFDARANAVGRRVEPTGAVQLGRLSAAE
jgi:hypothetical protein